MVQLHQRHILDAWLMITVVTLGYMFVFPFVSTEGAKYLRLRTELELAERVQAQLVPPLGMSAAGLAIFGKSIPSSRVGGDLVDAVSFDGSLTCYLGDVSGHGIAAGVLMSMVKSAVRTSLSRAGKQKGDASNEIRMGTFLRGLDKIPKNPEGSLEAAQALG